MFRRARSAIYQTVGRFLGRLWVRTRSDKKRVLFACHNAMMATYLAEVCDLIKDDPRIVVRGTVKVPTEREGDIELCEASLGCKFLSPRIVKILPWDLVVMANHPRVFSDLALKSARKVLRIPHGIGSKLVDGVDYMYNDSCFDSKGDLVYDRFLDSSQSRKELAEAQNPIFKGKVSVVGSIRLDRIEARRGGRVRSTNGSRKRVLVVGSWGKGNVYDYLQHSDFKEIAKELEQEYSFVLRPHPNLLSTFNSDSLAFAMELEEWGKLGNVEISAPGTELESDLADCDLVFGDDLTSVTLFASALDVPVALFRTGNAGVGEGTYLSRLSEAIPYLRADEELPDLLRRSILASRSSARADLTEDLHSYPNQAEQRTREEVYDLLELSVSSFPN